MAKYFVETYQFQEASSEIAGQYHQKRRGLFYVLCLQALQMCPVIEFFILKNNPTLFSPLNICKLTIELTLRCQAHILIYRWSYRQNKIWPGTDWTPLPVCSQPPSVHCPSAATQITFCSFFVCVFLLNWFISSLETCRKMTSCTDSQDAIFVYLFDISQEVEFRRSLWVFESEYRYWPRGQKRAYWKKYNSCCNTYTVIIVFFAIQWIFELLISLSA